MASKQELKSEIGRLNGLLDDSSRDNYNNKLTISRLEEIVAKCNEKIRSLHVENDLLTHTPEFAADTESAYNRGSAQAARSVAYNNILYSLDIVRELRVVLDEQEQKYRRETAYDIFTGAQPTEQEDQALPQTDFTAKLLQNALDKRD